MKKIIALVLALVLTVAASVAGTVAYLQAEDSDVNVMTLGNVEIEQIEQERAENGTLQDFTQGQPAYPAVGPVEWADKGVNVNGTEYLVFTEKLQNVIDKIVTVKNTGKSDAYVRTIIALEAPDYDPNDLIHVNVSPDGISQTRWTPVDINGVKYVYSVFTYNAALKAGKVSTPSLVQVFLDSKATNEDVAKFGETWDIRVLSQAVQTEGFANAAEALDTAFEEATADNVAEWFGGMMEPILVSTPQELKDAMLVRGATIALTDDIIVDKETPLQWGAYMFVANGREMTIDLNGHSIILKDDALLKTKALFTTANGGTLNVTGVGTVEIKNGKSGIFHAMNKNDQINVYGGTYISNSDNGSDALAIIYTNSGSVDVYGGNFIPADGVTCANAEDIQGNRLSVLFHEGTLLKHDKYYEGSDATRIQLEEGCELKEVTINGETWYQVSKK